jgi:hypothetical protein
MAVLSLPLSFNNSFWSQDYRRGLEVLFAKLEQVSYVFCRVLIIFKELYQGVAENDEITTFIMVIWFLDTYISSRT